MPLHRLDSLTMGVQNVTAARASHEEFGLIGASDGWLETAERGRQLRPVPDPAQSLMQIDVGADDPGDFSRIVRHLDALGVKYPHAEETLAADEPVTQIQVSATITRRLTQTPPPPVTYNLPGHAATGVTRTPESRGPVWYGPDDSATSSVDDLDEVGRSASNMPEGHPQRHVVWYPKDPAGTSTSTSPTSTASWTTSSGSQASGVPRTCCTAGALRHRPGSSTRRGNWQDT